jgi:hypothetical protein
MAVFRKANFCATSEAIMSVSHSEVRQDDSKDSIQNFIRFHINRVSSSFLNQDINFYQDDFQDNHSEDVNQVEQTLQTPTHRDPKDISQDIKALEPHLEAYQRLVHENASMGNDDVTDNIPPQILRAIRFFPHKWEPLKRALLRPPSAIEVGSTIRMKLVRELYMQDMISTPEIRLLEQALNEVRSSKQNSKKRPREEYSINEQLKMTLTSLPLDIASLETSAHENARITNSLNHLENVLNDYCQYSPAHGEDYPPSELVAEWVLQAFSSIIISNGINNTTQTEAEVHFSKIFLEDEQSKRLKISSAIRNRIQELLHSDSVDELTDLNILCLSRFLALMNVEEVVSIIRKCLISCSTDRCTSVGFTTVPKILASYIMIVHHNHEKPSFRYNFQSLVETNLASEVDTISFKRSNAFLKNVFQSCNYILDFGDQ